MRRTNVPAQITTVEDRIVGNLDLTQVALFSLPIVAVGLVFAVCPPLMSFTVSKIVGLTLLAIICIALGIRKDDVLILHRLIIRVQYNLRPRYFVYDKNTTANRRGYASTQSEASTHPEQAARHILRRATRLTTAEIAKVYATVEDEKTKVSFVTGKKGELHVRISQVEADG